MLPPDMGSSRSDFVTRLRRAGAGSTSSFERLRPRIGFCFLANNNKRNNYIFCEERKKRLTSDGEKTGIKHAAGQPPRARETTAQ